MAMSKGFGRPQFGGQNVDATRHGMSQPRARVSQASCVLHSGVLLVLVLDMASSSSSVPNLPKELEERFGDTNGSDEYFIEQCASTQIL